MDKPIKVKLEKNQMVVTEAQYTVAVLFIKTKMARQVDGGAEITNENKLQIMTVRATSINEAKGMVLDKMRESNFGWTIHGYVVEKTGE